MSYSAYGPVTKTSGQVDQAELDAALDKQLEILTFDDDAHKAATAEHIELAKKIVGDIAAGVGRANESFTVSVSGHANAGHAPSDRWADEAMTISVSVRQGE